MRAICFIAVVAYITALPVMADRAIDRRAPKFDGLVRRPRALDETAQIDIGRHEIRVDRDRLLQRFSGRGRIPRLAVQAEQLK